MMNGDPVSPFEAANFHLGHGEPEHAVWYVGLEYADAPGSGFEAVQEYVRDREPSGSEAAIARPKRAPDFSSLGGKGRSIRLLTSRTLVEVSREATAKGLDHNWFLKNRLWWPASETFQANLFPLSRPTHDSQWPDLYTSEFGLRGWEDYVRRVREERFPLLRRYWNNSDRKAVVCFGKGEWPLFKEAFGIKSEGEWLVPNQVQVHRDERVLLVPFLSFRFFSYAEAKAVGGFLRDELGVAIP